MAMIIDDTYNKAVLVTPSDSADVTLPSGYSRTKGLYVGASGTLKVTMSDGNAVTFTGIAAGVIHRISVKRVWSTGTTATGVIVLY